MINTVSAVSQCLNIKQGCSCCFFVLYAVYIHWHHTSFTCDLQQPARDTSGGQWICMCYVAQDSNNCSYTYWDYYYLVKLCSPPILL